ncbi:uncharacterized protein LOC113488816 isoform X1 [Athene cunicularia]|uniref:uncharacterized protein LOC113488816 isoform X1 n=1 Tax=Athene cunicularia TaxID=194338 RepID=UPI000EF69497|nr:uncharacterized protein LOC113488816 isoform X1 [Athene cunicularia]XP_026719955.1 uncharacterized protein LOC113488816 isoform X1 [Athene cunicularia]XP_026719956.1 uncharacterized protein LOC113488816 isoform X1 [Athene cunicularia]
MFSQMGYRRGFPREPNPWPGGRARGPRDVWYRPPVENQRRGWGHQHQRGSWGPRPFPGPDNFHENEEDGRWGTGEDRRRASYNCPPQSPWNNREGDQGPEDFKENEDWDSSGPWDPRPFPGPDNFHGYEEDEGWEAEEDWRCETNKYREWGPDDEGEWGTNEDWRWRPDNCPRPSSWDDGGCQGPEDFFENDWNPEQQQPGRNDSAWFEFPSEEQHPCWAPANLLRGRGNFRRSYMAWQCHGLSGKRWQQLHHGYQELTFVQHFTYPWDSRGNPSHSRAFPSHSGRKQSVLKEMLRPPNPPRPHTASKDGAESTKQMAQVAVSTKALEPPKPAAPRQESTAADPQAATEAAEPEQAAGATPVGEQVEPGVGSHSQSPSASEMEPATLEESSASTGEHLEVEPLSQSVPEADEGSGSHPQGPAAPPKPAEKVCVVVGSAGEVGAELCPCSRGQQRLLSGAGEAETEAARDGLLGDLQPPENLQVLPVATPDPDAQPSKACSDTCTTPETSPGTQHPPGSGETEPAAGSQQGLPKRPPASTDLRSAAILARKEEIELLYQKFSLTIAVVATMLLQKEPSMEAALGLALRANLRQGRIRLLQELEDFINSYDSATFRP